MIHKVSDRIWKISLSSNIYFLDFFHKLVIDAGDWQDRQELSKHLSKLVNLDEINTVIFTHLHYDHIGNFDLFNNAQFYASSKAIVCLKKDPLGTVLNKDIATRFDVHLKPARDMHELRIIETPGHTAGSLCIWYEKERILFSGDTIFDNGVGRTDLPTSVPEKLQSSIDRLNNLDYGILCPGHDY